MATAVPALAQDTSLLRYGGPDRSRRLIAAAQKEGSFALYTSFAEKDLPPLTILFEKKYDVKVKVWRAANVPESYSPVVLSMGEDKGILLFRDPVARNGISVRTGHSLLSNMVVAGEVPLALTVYNVMAEAARRKCAAIDWFALEPAVARMSGVGIARRAPHPNAALLFYDFMLSTEAQELLVTMEYVPTNATVRSPLAVRRFTLVDPAVALDQSDKWTKSFEEVILRQGGR